MPDDTALHAEIRRLEKIVRVLMDRAERSTNLQGSDFDTFQTTLMLEERVQQRTIELEQALRDNEQINRNLRESEAKYHGLVEQSFVGIAIIDNGRFTYTNPRFASIFGYDEVEILNLHPLDIITPTDRHLVSRHLGPSYANDSKRFHVQVSALRKDGEPLDIEMHGATTEVNGKYVLVYVIQDITERCRAEREILVLQEKVREQSIRDPLTDLYNRRYLEETLNRELRLAKRQQHPISLIMCDLDHFKRVNDQYGHPAGDHVLRFFAAQIRRSARESDINCRYGGEEFLIVLPGMARREAIQRAELLRQRIAETPIDFHSKRISLTASFGIASAPENGTDAEILIAAADQALYAAKNAGRNRVAD